MAKLSVMTDTALCLKWMKQEKVSGRLFHPHLLCATGTHDPDALMRVPLTAICGAGFKKIELTLSMPFASATMFLVLERQRNPWSRSVYILWLRLRSDDADHCPFFLCFWWVIAQTKSTLSLCPQRQRSASVEQLVAIRCMPSQPARMWRWSW